MTTPNDKDAPKSLPFSIFLESTPPEAKQAISGLFPRRHSDYGKLHWIVNSPDIQLHCPTATCGGDRIFRCCTPSDNYIKNSEDIFLTYVCRNCEKHFKTYALRVVRVLVQTANGDWR